MRPVTLNLSAVKDPAAISAFQEIQRASQDTLQNDTSSSGSAMATLTGAGADEIAYFTSATTTAYTSLTAFGRSIIGAASAAASLTLLGVSSFVQGLLTAVDAPTFLTGLGFSAFVESIIGSASASAFRTAIGAGTGSGNGTVTSVATGAGLSGGTITTSGTLVADPAYHQGYLGGLTLSNDGGTPNTVLDVAAGVCVDSTNATFIKLAAFTKSTGGSWTAGSGNNGMGTGLTIANTTWYHVFSIINGGNADVYFDTSITAANKPASTTAFRRIGSFKTDGSAHIKSFFQNGDVFMWVGGASADFNGSVSTTAASPSTATLNVPTGLKIEAFVRGNASSSSSSAALLIYSPDEGSTLATGAAAMIGSTNNSAGQFGYSTVVRTNTSGQVFAVMGAGAGAPAAAFGAYGWTDTRGRFI